MNIDRILGSVVLAAGVVGTVHAEGDIIFDNGPVDPQVGSPNSGWDPTYPFYAAAADDFIFSSLDFPGPNTMTITGFNWSSRTFGPGGMAQITDIRILIWPDAGGFPAGGQPPGLPPDESQALHIFEIPGNGNEMPTADPNRFTYSLKLPTPVKLEKDVIYWLQIQVVLIFFPQWTWAASGTPGNAVQGLAFWTPTGTPLELSFQLQGFKSEATDCNRNGVPDQTDIADGTSEDFNGNGIPDVCDACPDVDGSGEVNTLDLLLLLLDWGPQKPGHPADFNGDGYVGTSDLLELLSNWGACP